MNTKTPIDTIRNGKFAATDLEELRLQIISLDCGITYARCRANGLAAYEVYND